jgi:glycosyltransferase involved in cell wall biosynthesis
MLASITFIIMVKNGQETLKKTLDSLRNCSHVLVCDTGSVDSTIEIAKSYPNVFLKQIPFNGFGPTRNEATSFTTTDFVFHLDADEVLTRSLLEELSVLNLDEQLAYEVKRDNIFFGKIMQGCSGWSNDYVTRLYNKKNFSFSQDLVHEKVNASKKAIIRLKNPLEHTPYLSFYQMLDKLNHYSELFCKNTKKTANRLSPFTHGFFSFFKSYILKLGFKEGYRGLVLSLYIAHGSFYKYLKLYQKQNWKP